MSRALSPRWLLSFADLALLLLGFFILLHASGANVGAVTAGTRAAFAGTAAPTLLDTRAASLFEPGEARLTPVAQARLRSIAQRARAVVVESSGKDGGGNRFDSWELAAARAAAVARSLQQGGLAEGEVRIVMAPERAGEPARGQRLVLR